MKPMVNMFYIHLVSPLKLLIRWTLLCLPDSSGLHKVILSFREDGGLFTRYYLDITILLRKQDTLVALDY